MADEPRPWWKQLETLATFITALSSVLVPVMLYVLSERVAENQQAAQDRQHQIDEQNTERNLVIQAVGFLVDDSVAKRQAGFVVVQWLKDNNLDIPPTVMTLATTVTKTLTPTATTSVSTDSADTEAGGPAATASENLSQTASDAISGLVPRIFIHFEDEDQRPTVQALRASIQQMKLDDGGGVLVPGVDHMMHTTPDIELRFLKKADQAEAARLATLIGKILGQTVNLKDFSAQYDSRRNVKPRTYELWLPQGGISLAATP